jgi:hypothetical protein
MVSGSRGAAPGLRDFLCEVHVHQGQLAAWSAGLRGVTTGTRREDEAITRLERSPYGVWPASDPASKVLLVMDVGPRTLARAPRAKRVLSACGWPINTAFVEVRPVGRKEALASG